MNWRSPLIEKMVISALEEDIWTGDVTSMSIIPPDKQAKGRIWTKVDGVMAGLPLLPLVFAHAGGGVQVDLLAEDGQAVTAGTTLAEISGSARTILMGERVALNFLQHLSAVASRVSRLAELIKFYTSVIVDTRKTIPGLRLLQKYAVRMGGGANHRFGLYDAVLIKDNHIAVAGGIKEAVTAARRHLGHTVKIEVEVETLEQVATALESHADIIMLDNMNPDLMKQAIDLVDGKALTEASGRVTEENIVQIAKTGVDFISIGAITHSVQALDISLDIEIS
ncbi:MAG: carboxylating nicotinate-nucleotide diphosphorylase [Bacillota bacterium]|jgi:nicotinate-nucleotide pyrophosphorylase (carboxylating)